MHRRHRDRDLVDSSLGRTHSTAGAREIYRTTPLRVPVISVDNPSIARGP